MTVLQGDDSPCPDLEPSSFAIDLHLHTNRGSSDSNLTPAELIEQARLRGLDAVCITEHDTMWDFGEVAEWAAMAGIVVLRGMEVTTEAGHIGVIGLPGYLGGIYKLKQLRRIADDHGAVLIANHPFRYRLDPRFAFFNPGHSPVDPHDPAAAAAGELFSLVDAIEVINGACAAEENRFATRVAHHLGLAQVGGSDSHSAGSIGCAFTALAHKILSERDLIDAIAQRRCRAVEAKR